MPEAKHGTLAERSRRVAVDALAGMTAYQWLTVAELAHAHVTGALSLDGWTTATGAVIDQALHRLDIDGPSDILRKG